MCVCLAQSELDCRQPRFTPLVNLALSFILEHQRSLCLVGPALHACVINRETQITIDRWFRARFTKRTFGGG